MSYIDNKGKAVKLLKTIVEGTNDQDKGYSRGFAEMASSSCSLWPKMSAHVPEGYNVVETDSGLLVVYGSNNISLNYSTVWRFSVEKKGLKDLSLLLFYVSDGKAVFSEHEVKEGFQEDTDDAEAKLVFYENGLLKCKDTKEKMVTDISDLMIFEFNLRKRGFLSKKQNEEDYYALQRAKNDSLIAKYSQKDYFLTLVQITRDER